MSPSSTKKLFLLDAMALVYRAYFAFSNNHRVNSKGLNTSAIFGFTNTLLEILKKENPTHMAVVFDTAAPTVRHVEFADYKANREEMPEDLSKAIPFVIKLIEGFNIPVISYDGFEADDIIGTLAKKAEQQGFITYMMTPDKDYGQLVSENIFIYKPARLGNGAEIMGVAEVCKKWNIKRIDQVVDMLGLMGDAVDNIPGVPGVGEKTAMQLIQDFDNIENLLQNTDKLKGKLKEKIEQNAEKAVQSKRLATIICDVPIELNEELLLRKELNKETLKELFLELEFRKLAEQVLGEKTTESEVWNTNTTPKKQTGQMDMFGHVPEVEINQEIETAEIPSFKTIQDLPHQYYLVDTSEKIKELIKKLLQQEAVCFDTETTSLNVFEAEIVGVSFSFQSYEAYYIPVSDNHQEALSVLEELKPFFENEKIKKVGQNIKYDLSVLRRYGIQLKGYLFDTMIAHFLIKPEMRHNMDILAETYLQYSPVSIETLIGKKGKDQLSMRSVPVSQIAEYAAEDADITWQLKNTFEPMLKEVQAQQLFDEIEMPLVPVLAAMEYEGVKVDKQTLQEFSAELAKDIQQLDKEIQTMAGTTFNIASPKQVGDVLFEVLKIVEKPKKTKTGQYATSEDVLIKLVGKHPIVEKILDYRELQKLKNTYVDTLPELINEKTQRIHTSYNQVVAVTGRLSSDNPNLQNIPIRTTKGKEVRKAFVPRNEEYTLLSADYSQIELRIIAELSGDAAMIEAFHSKQDIHTATAAKVYGVDLTAVTADMRRNAKMVNFGIIYGISAFGLSERLNIPRKEAAAIIEQYFTQYPGIKTYMDKSIANAKEKGYVETIMGRKRYLRDINSGNATVRGFAERNAINAPIQGSAADMIKIAMIRVSKAFEQKQFKSKMILQVHDELVFDAHKEEVDIIKPIIRECMVNAISMKVPIEVEIGVGPNWLEAH